MFVFVMDRSMFVFVMDIIYVCVCYGSIYVCRSFLICYVDVTSRPLRLKSQANTAMFETPVVDTELTLTMLRNTSTRNTC